MIVRFRRSGQEQRLQLKWFMYASAVAAVVVVVVSQLSNNPLPAFEICLPADPGRRGNRDPEVPAVRDRPADQPHPGLCGGDRAAGRGVRGAGHRGHAGVPVPHARGGRRVHAGGGGAVQPAAAAGAAGGGQAVQPGPLRRGPDGGRVRGPAPGPGGPRHGASRPARGGEQRRRARASLGVDRRRKDRRRDRAPWAAVGSPGVRHRGLAPVCRGPNGRHRLDLAPAPTDRSI